MCITAFTTSFVSAVNSSVSAVVSFGTKLAVRYYAQSPARTALSVATVICREGIKLKVNAYLNKKWQKRKAKIVNGLKMTISKTFKWPMRVIKRSKRGKLIRRGDEAFAIDATVRYQKCVEQRLERARYAFQAAEMELRQAELEFKEAIAYVKTVRSIINSTPELRRCRSSSDIVFVEYSE
jgi:hypothetical protein